jgi:RNA polymerase sigma factor (sigma-70 family)
MGYRVRCHRAVEDDWTKCGNTYPQMARRLNRWIDDLAKEAESRKWSLSTDLAALLEHADELEEMVRAWPTLWQRFWNAPFVEKLKAALVVMTQFRPPYEYREANRVFRIYAVTCEVSLLYIVDHTAKEIIIFEYQAVTPAELSAPELASDREMIAVLQQALSALSARDKLAIETWMDGASAREIADTIGATEATARQVLHRALGRIRQSVSAVQRPR